MQNIVVQCKNFAKLHRLLTATIAFALAMLIVGASFFPAINVQYSIDIEGDIPANQKVVFTFDRNNQYPASSKQIAYPINNTASVRVDSLNQDSQSLTISTTKASDITGMKAFRARVVIGDKSLYQVAELPPSDFTRNEDSGTLSFSLDANRLHYLYRMMSFFSEIKIGVLIALLVAYVLTLLRLSLLAAVQKTHFAAIAGILILILGFFANLWLIKTPITYHTSYQYESTAIVESDAAYTIKQSFVAQQDELRSIRLPISVSPYVSPTDTTNEKYHEVYINSHQYRNRYIFTVVNDRTNHVLYNGLLLPDYADSNNTYAEIPVHDSDSRGNRYTITVHKIDETQASVALQLGTVSAENDSYPHASISGDDVHAEGDQWLSFSPGYQGFPYRTLISVIVIGLLILIIINLATVNVRFHRLIPIVCLTDYVVLGLYACIQSAIYIRYIGGFPDEQAHLSYIAYLKKTGEIFPDFSQMQIYDAPTVSSLDLAQPIEFNRLGHPPLFYLVESLLGGLSMQGSVVNFSLTRLRLISFALGLLGIAVVYYIGFTRIRKLPILHLLFALLIISPPNLIYSISGVSNDSLALLGVSVFVLGVVRFIEKRFNLYTYIILALGASVVALDKMTATMMIFLIVVGVVVYTIHVERNCQVAFNKPAFYASLPVYLIPAGYFGWLFAKFHTLQPSFQKLDFAGYVHSSYYVDINNRLSMGFWEYIEYYVTHFLDTWHTIAGTVYVPKPQYPYYAIDRIAVMAILVIPLIVFLIKRSRVGDYCAIAIGSVLAVMVYQGYSAFNGFHVNGYPGAYSSRYYACVVSVFALTIIWLICQAFSKEDSEIKQASLSSRSSSLTNMGIAVCALWSMWLIFDGFVYSVLYHADSLAGFVG